MKLYLSGPMTGLPDLNYPAFNAEAARLRSLGYDVVNPAELNAPDTPYHQCMETDIRALLDCDAIAFLPKWEHSKGACLEGQIALTIGMISFGQSKHLKRELSSGTSIAGPILFETEIEE